MEKIQNIDGENKAKLTSMDKLIFRYVELAGITSAKAMAEDLDIPHETARTWIRRYRTKGFDHTGSITPGVQSQRFNHTTEGSITPPKGFDHTTSPRAHAYKENPSGLNISSSKLASSAHMREIEGLNGSTTMWVEKLANWLAGDLGTPNLNTARTLIESSVDCYGPQQVKIGMLELEAKIASGEKFRDLARGFSQFVKNAKSASASPFQNRKQAEADKSRRFDELLESMEFPV